MHACKRRKSIYHGIERLSWRPRPKVGEVEFRFVPKEAGVAVRSRQLGGKHGLIEVCVRREAREGNLKSVEGPFLLLCCCCFSFRDAERVSRRPKRIA